MPKDPRSIPYFYFHLVIEKKGIHKKKTEVSFFTKKNIKSPLTFEYLKNTRGDKKKVDARHKDIFLSNYFFGNIPIEIL